MSNSRRLDVSEFRSRYEHLESNQVVENDIVVLHGRLQPLYDIYNYPVLRIVGRIRSHRLAGSKLIFFDIVQNGHKVQAMCNQRVLAGVTPEKFKDLYRLLRRGDAFCRSQSA
jgi:lysyl-tRNA synthetase class 2